jgi:putative intracellular protease/amidase
VVCRAFDDVALASAVGSVRGPTGHAKLTDMTSIDVLVFDGCEALDALGPYEVLAYGGLDVRAVTRTERRLVRTSPCLKLQGDATRDGAEWLIVPGGAWDAHHRYPRGEAAAGAVGALACAHH